MNLLFLPETARNIVGNGETLLGRWGRPLVSSVFGMHIPEASRPSTVKIPSKKVISRAQSFKIFSHAVL